MSSRSFFLTLALGALIAIFGQRVLENPRYKVFHRGSGRDSATVARWVPNPERGEPDSTLSGGRR